MVPTHSLHAHPSLLMRERRGMEGQSTTCYSWFSPPCGPRNRTQVIMLNSKCLHLVCPILLIILSKMSHDSLDYKTSKDGRKRNLSRQREKLGERGDTCL